MADSTRDQAVAAALAAADEMRQPAARIVTLTIPEITPEAADRFLAKVTFTETGCHDWTAYRTPDGYGRFRLGGRMYYAHRVSWAWRNGRIPSGMTLDHLCRNTSCVNPDHLDPVTTRENLLRGDTINAAQLARSCCPRGHLLAGANLQTGSLRRAMRGCRICSAVRSDARNRVRRAGGDLEARRAASLAAVEALSGDETPESAGLAPLGLHYALGLVERQIRFDLEAAAS